MQGTFSRTVQKVVPDEAIALVEDIQTLDRILDLLGTLRKESVIAPTWDYAKARSEAQQTLRRVAFLISGMHSIARDNLRYHYLAGRQLKRHHKRLTLADVWQILMDGKESLNESHTNRSNPA